MLFHCLVYKKKSMSLQMMYYVKMVQCFLVSSTMFLHCMCLCALLLYLSPALVSLLRFIWLDEVESRLKIS